MSHFAQAGAETDVAVRVVAQVCVPLPPWAMRAGARENIFYNPAEINVAIVTCGGLCPGLNDVVQGLVNKLSDYGVPEGQILGIKCGTFWSHHPGSHPLLALIWHSSCAPSAGQMPANLALHRGKGCSQDQQEVQNK